MTPRLSLYLANRLQERVFRGSANRLVWALVDAMEDDWGEDAAMKLVDYVHERTGDVNFRTASQLLHFLAPQIIEKVFPLEDKDDDGGPSA